MEELVEKAAEALARSRHAIALTGAGVSTASGIPDFRGPRGLWKRIPPETFTVKHFQEHPMEVWRLYMEAFKTILEANPNPAHYALAALEQAGIVKAVITQNIDGLHQKAGSHNVIELHGNAYWAKCTICGHRVRIEEAFMQLQQGALPRCPRCGGLLKPDVVFFGEPLPPQALHRAIHEATRADVMLVAGTSLYVAPANQLPIIAKQRGATIITVNQGPLYINIGDIHIEAPVEQALPQICRKTLEKKGYKQPTCNTKRKT